MWWKKSDTPNSTSSGSRQEGSFFSPGASKSLHLALMAREDRLMSLRENWVRRRRRSRFHPGSSVSSQPAKDTQDQTVALTLLLYLKSFLVAGVRSSPTDYWRNHLVRHPRAGGSACWSETRQWGPRVNKLTRRSDIAYSRRLASPTIRSCCVSFRRHSSGIIASP